MTGSLVLAVKSLLAFGKVAEGCHSRKKKKPPDQTGNSQVFGGSNLTLPKLLRHSLLKCK
jgi:hypothetical protein